MGVITNNYTSQKPMSATGKTGAQVGFFIPASRVFIGVAESTTAAPVQKYCTKSNGSLTPYTGYTDLGTMLGNGTINYSKSTQKVQTGVDKYTRHIYVDSKEMTIEFTLAQLDDVTMEEVTGLTASVLVSGSTVSFTLGSETLVNKALLVIYENKLDGKEWQLYHPSALLDFQIVEQDNGLAMKVTATLTPFTASGNSTEQLVNATVFDKNL